MKILRTRISHRQHIYPDHQRGYRRLSEKNSDLEGAALSLEAVLPENQAKDGWNFELRKSKDVLDSRRVIIGYIHHQDGAKG